MTGIYLISAFVITGLLFINRNTLFNNLLIIVFGLLQLGFTFFACANYNNSVLRLTAFNDIEYYFDSCTFS